METELQRDRERRKKEVSDIKILHSREKDIYIYMRSVFSNSTEENTKENRREGDIQKNEFTHALYWNTC
jgi:hypothetical protein